MSRTRQIARGRNIRYLGLFTFAFCLVLQWLWFSEPAEEWRLRRAPLAALQQQVDAGRADFQAAFILGERLTGAGRYEEAERTFRKLIGADPENWRAYVQLGTLLAHTGRQSEAFQVLMIPVNRNPGLAEAHLALGDLLLSRQAYPQAIRELDVAVRLDPRRDEAWYQLSQCYDALAQPTAARHALEQAIHSNPRHDRYPVELARLLGKEGQPDAARGLLTRALALNPGSAPAHYTLGEMLAARPDPAAMEAAAAQFRATLRLAPGYPPARYQLGLLAIRHEDWTAAAAELEAALKVAPAFKEAVFNLARVYDQQGRKALARRQRELFVRLTEQEQQILDLRTRIGFGGGDPPTYLRLARAYRASGDLDRAYETLVAAVQRAPNDPATRAEMRAAAALTGRPFRTGLSSSMADSPLPTISQSSSSLTRPASLKASSPSPARKAPPPSPALFTDVTAAAGLRFRYGYGGRSPLDLMEVSGGGAGFLDVDGDGWLDILLVGQRRCALFHNNRNGTFTDVTQRSGLTAEGWWMGCAAGDWNNDGHVDLFLAGYRGSRMYLNRGDGRFRDVTKEAGVAPPGWASGAAFADVDRDGRLDLYVGRYARFDEHSIRFCTIEGVKTSCGPEMYDPERGFFYHNEGGRFREATARFGLAGAHGKTWGVCFGDMNNDGWPDLYLANDELPCDLYVNHGGRFRNIGLESGTAFSRDGVRQGGMGADWGDYDNDGRLDLVVTTFFEQPKSLYHNEGGGQFAEVSDVTGIAAPTMPYVAFGTRFFDLDNDGWLDLFIANGHVRDNPERIDPAVHFAQPMQLFHNEPGPPLRGGAPSSAPGSGAGARTFRDISAAAGPAFQRPVVGRAAAFGDFDNDGAIDILVADAAGAPLLLHNEAGRSQHWLTVRVLGPKGGSDAIGARVTITAGGKHQLAEANPGGSFFAANDPRVHFGLGTATKVDRLEVRWPSGRTEQRRDVAADQFLTLREHP